MLLRRVVDHLRTQNWTAVGLDFIIVVLGVFIGIQFSNLNEALSNRALETAYLDRLGDDLRDDIRTFDEMLAIFTIKKNLIIALRDGPPSGLLTGDPVQAAKGIEYTYWKALPGQRRATFDELIGAGNLTLLHNIELRNGLAEYYGGYDRIAEITFEPVGKYRSLFSASMPGDIALENLTNPDQATVDRILAGLNKLRGQEYFEEAANAEIYYARDLIGYLRSYRSEAEGLIEVVQKAKPGYPNSIQ